MATTEPSAEQLQAEQDRQKRKILFTRATSKEMLHKWIEIFLELDIPDCIVDPESTSSPMDMIYEVYSKSLNNDPDFSRVMYYASRESFKTWSAAIIEVLCLLHLGRSVGHMAAIEGQSQRCQGYVKDFFAKPILREFVVGDNLKKQLIIKYVHKVTGETIPPVNHKLLPPSRKDEYEKFSTTIDIVICSDAGANSLHTPFFCVDEVDVVRDPGAYDEAKMIPSPVGNMLPVTMLISTRKSVTGLVQKEIDEEFDKKTGARRLWIRHWNIIDVTRACQPERHLPQEPKIPIYVDEQNLSAIPESKFDLMTEADQAKYVKEEGYAGCLKNCQLFAACHGWLATRQKSTSELLKPITHTINRIAELDAATVIAQMLCKKPSSTGLIYPNFDRTSHMLTAAQMAEKALGYPVDPKMTKKELIKVLQAKGWVCHSGMDFGFTHNFAVVTAFTNGYLSFVIDVIAQPQLMPDAQIRICNTRLKKLNPVIFGDPESPKDVATLRRAGFRMREWNKGAGSLIGGINLVRLRLRPPLSSEPLLFFLAGDVDVEVLVYRLGRYHWKRNAIGELTDTPSEKDDDECDALRYLILNVFDSEGGKIQVAGDEGPGGTPEAPLGVYTVENWMGRVIDDAGARNPDFGGPADGTSGKRGRFRWVF